MVRAVSYNLASALCDPAADDPLLTMRRSLARARELEDSHQMVMDEVRLDSMIAV